MVLNRVKLKKHLGFLYKIEFCTIVLPNNPPARKVYVQHTIRLPGSTKSVKPEAVANDGSLRAD